MNTDKRDQIFSRLALQNPNPRTELHYHSHFELLIAVMLSAQATDKSVNKATEALFKIANTPQAMYRLGETGLKKYIQTIGLYNNKSKNIIQTCKIICDQFDGQIPTDRENLEKLPGVGRKTANVMLNTAFGEPVIAVDTHVFRVANRTKIAPGRNVLDVEKKLAKLVPEPFRQNAHHLLILLGRYTCTARKPKCNQCPIVDLCEFKQKTNTHHSSEKK